jgi:hypothetical protein
MNIADGRAISTDMELENGIFKLGAKYYIRTPTFHYIGVLKAVTPTVFVFESTATVYESGDYKSFFAGKGKDIQYHEGAFEMVIDRGATSLIRMK